MRVKPLVISLVVAVVVAVVGGIGAFKLTDVTYQPAQRIPPVSSSAQAPVPPTTSSSEAPPLPVRQPVAQSMPTSLTVWKEGEAPLFGPKGISPDPAVADDATGIVNVKESDQLYVQNDPRLDWAVLPGTGTGTTIFLCHTFAEGDLPCNALGTIPTGDATGTGYRARMELPTGTMTAELVYVHPREKTRSKDWPILFTKEKDRWLVGMCRLVRDSDTGQVQNTYEFSFLEFRLIESVSH